MTHCTSALALANDDPDERATPLFRPLILGRATQGEELPALPGQPDVADRGASGVGVPDVHTLSLAAVPRAASPASLLVVDDDENLLRMLRRGLAFAGYQVRMAADGQTALRLALEDEPDLIVLDVMLPEPLDGLEVARRLRAGGSNVPVLMLTAREQLADKIAGFASGADDYLAKPFAFEELLARVAALLRRSPRSSATEPDEVLQYADLSLDPTTREAWRGGQPIELTAREFDVLAYFLRHPRQVLSRDQLFRGVWGSDFLGGSNVVDSCVSCIRQKLEAGGRPRLLQTVRGVGYALRV